MCLLLLFVFVADVEVWCCRCCVVLFGVAYCLLSFGWCRCVASVLLLFVFVAVVLVCVLQLLLVACVVVVCVCC